MIELPRRKFLIAAAGLIAAPAIVRAGSIMPVKVVKNDFYAFDGVMDFGAPETHLLAEAEFRTMHRTDNPAVVFLDILNAADKSIGGRIDWKSLGIAADYCAESIHA